PKLITEQLLVPLFMLGIYWLSGYYNSPFGKSRLEEFITTLFSAIINTAIIFLVFLINDTTFVRKVNYELILVLFSLLFLCSYSGRLLITNMAIRHFRKNEWHFRTLVIGNSRDAHSTAARFRREAGRVEYKIVGYFPIAGEEDVDDGRVFREYGSVAELCREQQIDQIVLAPQRFDEKRVLDILYHLFDLNIPIKIAPDTYSLLTSSVRLKDIYGEPFVDLTTPALSESAKNVKRVCDVVISALVLLLLSPLLIWAACGVRMSSKGPVFYSQERIGRRHRPFRIYKFRTMYENAETGTPRLSSDDDPRVTPFGRILRKYRIDEIPQFWNVIKGEMSIVGPRPERAYYIEKIVERAPYYTLVCQVRPGITSWGMVKYGYASTVEEMVERTRFDLIYISNMSLFIDIKILIYSIRTIIRGEG
ncbi:MAG: sugar transferase, partial [Muribaculaceae bacterium]|nr:sugar transferase [Muribaculaceae bacterium]